MSPYIFPGLKPPKSKLFYDLQAFIAYNGGRLHLANVLECEAVRARPQRVYPAGGSVTSPLWKPGEDQLIIEGLPYEEVSRITGRSIPAIWARVHRLKVKKAL